MDLISAKMKVSKSPNKKLISLASYRLVVWVATLYLRVSQSKPSCGQQSVIQNKSREQYHWSFNKNNLLSYSVIFIEKINSLGFFHRYFSRDLQFFWNTSEQLLLYQHLNQNLSTCVLLAKKLFTFYM